MSEQRNDYGFPLVVRCMWGHWEQVGQNLEWRPNPFLPISTEQQHAENKRNGFFGPRMSKLERAQAYAAEVRARRFPPVTKFTTPKD